MIETTAKIIFRIFLMVSIIYAMVVWTLSLKQQEKNIIISSWIWKNIDPEAYREFKNNYE